LFNGNSLPRRLLGHLPSKLFFSRCDLTGSLLGSFPPHLLFNGRSLLGHLLDSRRNQSLALLIRPPPRLFFTLLDLTRGLLAGFPSSPLFSVSNGGLLGGLVRQCLRRRCLRRCHGVQLCRRWPRLLANVQLPLALFDRFAPGRFLLGVHVALDQPF